MPAYQWTLPPGAALQVLGSRSQEAASCLAWAVQAMDGLCYLEDIHEAMPTGRHLPGGHDALAVHIAHARWAASTSMTALDLCAAALGCLYLPRRKNDRYYDLRDVQEKRSSIPRRGVTDWLDGVTADDNFLLVDRVRDPLVHRTLPRQIALTFGSGTGDLVGPTRLTVAGFPDTVPVDEIMRASRVLAQRWVVNFVMKVGRGTI